MSGGLKPCPFCGGKAELTSIAWGDVIIFSVECGECHTMQPNRDTLREAVDAWNRRTRRRKNDGRRDD